MVKYHLYEHWSRSLAKAVSYRILMVILDFVLLYVLTNRIDIAVSFSLISAFLTSVAYYAHERVWNRIGHGRRKRR